MSRLTGPLGRTGQTEVLDRPDHDNRPRRDLLHVVGQARGGVGWLAGWLGTEADSIFPCAGRAAAKAEVQDGESLEVDLWQEHPWTVEWAWWTDELNTATCLAPPQLPSSSSSSSIGMRQAAESGVIAAGQDDGEMLLPGHKNDGRALDVGASWS